MPNREVLYDSRDLLIVEVMNREGVWETHCSTHSLAATLAFAENVDEWGGDYRIVAERRDSGSIETGALAPGLR